MKLFSRLHVLAIALGVALVPSMPAWAEDSHDHHDHHDHSAHGSRGVDGSAPALRLDAGEKWATDAPLREGMKKIRAAVERALKAAHAGADEPGQYQALGETVNQQLTHIVQNCRLEPEADTALHDIIGELASAGRAASEGGPDERMIGIVRLVAALDNYGVYFDHPGWTPVDTGH